MKYIKLVLFSFTLATLLAQVTDVRYEPDPTKKEKLAEKLVHDAAAFILKDDITIDAACQDFMRNPEWRREECFPIIMASDGTCYTYGDDLASIWNAFGTTMITKDNSLISMMLAQGEKGGWISYGWDNALQYTFAKVINKKGKTYVVASGFFPESARYSVHKLVETAVDYLKAHGAEETFAIMSNPRGMFVSGNMYLYAYNLKGVCVAHGENIGLVGQNLMDFKDADGKYRNRELIDLAVKQGSGWLEYKANKTKRVVYFSLVTDPKTQQQYVIGGGYYPDVNEETVKNLVKEGVRYLQKNGKEEAIRAFSGREMFFGSLRLFMYDMEGTVLADAETPEFVDQNLINLRDPDGKYIMRLIIEKVKKFNEGWVSYVDKNAYKVVFVEKVTIPGGTYIIGSGYYPESKGHWTRSMVDKATEFLQNNELALALDQFSSGNREFLRGDLSVTVYSEQGQVLVNGPRKQDIWEDIVLASEKANSQIQQLRDRFAAIASAGGGWLDYKHPYGMRRVFIRGVERENRASKQIDLYVVTAGYFT